MICLSNLKIDYAIRGTGSRLELPFLNGHMDAVNSVVQRITPIAITSTRDTWQELS